MYSSQGVQTRQLLRSTGFQLLIQEKRPFFRRGDVSCANSSGYVPNSHIRCCLQFRELVGFVRRELNVFCWLRQALIHIQTMNTLGRRSRPSSMQTQPFRPVRVMEAFIWAGIQDAREFCPLTCILSSGERKPETQSLSRCLPL